MKIGILGSGLMGGKLGTLFARAGHEVVFSYSRDPMKLARLALDAGNGARPGSPRDAVRTSDVLLLAVHWSRVSDVTRQAGSLSGKVVVSCTLPMSKSDSKLVVGRTSSGAEVLARKLRGARFVNTFGTVPSEVLFSVYEARRRRARRPTLVVCGNDARAKHVAARLARDIGFDPLDLGPLRLSRYTEPYSLLVARVAYDVGRGSRVTYRFEWWNAVPRHGAR